MADTKLTDLTELAAQPAVGDWLYIVDVSNTSDDASGSSRKILAKYFAATDGNASGVTITGGGTIALAGYTLTAPGTGTVVLTAATQTLTNKTLTSPTLTTPTLTLKQGASAAPTAEGDIQWDTDHNKLKVGDGASTKTFSDDSVTVVHGATGAVVGTTNTQTLTNKTLTTPTLTLKQGASVAPTAEGDIQWDTDHNKLKVGAGASTKTFSDDSVTVVHGATGAVVGTTNTQTLTNKTLTTPTLTLKQGASVAPTAEGDIQWDTDDNKLKVGDGVSTKTFSDDSVTVVHGATGAVVGTTNTQTLTNKTLTSPTINQPTLTLPTYTATQLLSLAGTAAQVVYCSTDKKLYWHDGTKWLRHIGAIAYVGSDE